MREGVIISQSLLLEVFFHQKLYFAFFLYFTNELLTFLICVRYYDWQFIWIDDCFMKTFTRFSIWFWLFPKKCFLTCWASENLGLELKNDPDLDMSAKLHQLCKIFCNNQFAIIFADLYVCIYVKCYDAKWVLC